MSKTNFAATLLAMTALLTAGASTARAEQGLITHKALSLDMAMTMAQGSLENIGKPMHIAFDCTEADMQTSGLACPEDEPCQVYLELANIEAAGNKLFLPGNLHTATTTMFSILLATEDAGKTWIEPHPRIRSAGLDQIQFIDFQNGWISGANLQSAPRDPFLLLTTDGGNA